MSAITRFFALRPTASWVLIVALSATIALLTGLNTRSSREQQEFSLLQTEAQRTGIDILSSTLHGNLMGSMAVLGLMDTYIKQDAVEGPLATDSPLLETLQTVGHAFKAEGVFVVGADGVVKSSWDRMNRVSTGLDVKHRPYYKMAMQGRASVYGAVSMSRGERALYFIAPVHADRDIASASLGAVVARTPLDQVDAILKRRFSGALLLSPQGVVFASSRADWVGTLDGPATPERLGTIRALKQFGPLFESKVPELLPISTSGGPQIWNGQRYAIASAPVPWNDPTGDWTVLLMQQVEDTALTSPESIQAAGAGLLALLLGWMCLHLLRGHYAQTLLTQQLRAHAAQQDADLAYRRQLATVSVQLQRADSVPKLATVFLVAARQLLGAYQGVLYAAENEGDTELRLAGFSACALPPSDTLTLGDGLLGQCALERKLQVIPTPAAGLWTIRSGLGSTECAALVLIPLVLQDKLVGALELAVMQVPDAATQLKFEELAALLTNNLELLRSHLRQRQLAPQAPDLSEATL